MVPFYQNTQLLTEAFGDVTRRGVLKTGAAAAGKAILPGSGGAQAIKSVTEKVFEIAVGGAPGGQSILKTFKIVASSLEDAVKKAVSGKFDSEFGELAIFSPNKQNKDNLIDSIESNGDAIEDYLLSLKGAFQPEHYKQLRDQLKQVERFYKDSSSEDSSSEELYNQQIDILKSWVRSSKYITKLSDILDYLDLTTKLDPIDSGYGGDAKEVLQRWKKQKVSTLWFDAPNDDSMLMLVGEPGTQQYEAARKIQTTFVNNGFINYRKSDRYKAAEQEQHNRNKREAEKRQKEEEDSKIKPLPSKLGVPSFQDFYSDRLAYRPSDYKPVRERIKQIQQYIDEKEYPFVPSLYFNTQRFFWDSIEWEDIDWPVGTIKNNFQGEDAYGVSRVFDSPDFSNVKE